MQEFNLVLYIIIISLFQILINIIFNFLIEKSIHKAGTTVKSKESKVFSSVLSIMNSICFMYSLYYLLIFVKTYLIPQFIEIFLSFEPLI